MKSISVYCKQEVEGWIKLPDELNFARPGMEQYTSGFINPEKAIHFLASVKTEGLLQMCYVSIAPFNAIKPEKPRKEIIEQIVLEAKEIIQSFFGDMQFSKAPDTVNDAKNFFSILDNNEIYHNSN